MIDHWLQEVTDSLEKTINTRIEHNDFKEVLKYSLLPPGKLFRPMLSYHLAHDLGEITTHHNSFAQALEIHHTYTLIHDDLPAMDDDDMRRGRPSSHKQFNQWKAILAGDSLLCLSFELIAQIEHPDLREIFNTFSQYTGGNGLILGQFLDLNNDNQNLEALLKIHELKTAKLIQLALIGPAIISNRAEILPELETLGKNLGINFQLLDDLCEFCDELNEHEKEINPFLKFSSQELFSLIKKNRLEMNEICQKHNLVALKGYIDQYHVKIGNKLDTNIERLKSFFDIKAEDIKDFCC